MRASGERERRTGREQSEGMKLRGREMSPATNSLLW